MIAPGSRAAEAVLLEEMERALPAASIPPAPVLVVVPSHILREHLLGRLLARRPAWLGLEVTTLNGIVASVLGEEEEPLRSGELVEPLLIARLAATERALSRSLGGLVRGYDEVVGAVRDLVDAGFLPEHLDACVERLEAERSTVGVAAAERAIAIVRVAARLVEALAVRGRVPAAACTARAARRISEDPERALPASAIFLHGFVDATGVASDLLEAMVRYRNTTVVLDRPPAPGGDPGSWEFGSRLLERLSGGASTEFVETPPLEPPRILLFRAADSARQARSAVGWLRESEESERDPGRDALVARNLATEGGRLSVELDRQGVAGSLPSGLPSRLGRHISALLALLARRADAPLGLALELAGERLEARCGLLVSDLRIACALRGARTLAAAADLEVPERSVRLLVSDRLERDDDGGATRARSREITAPALANARTELRRLRDQLRALDAPLPLARLAGALEEILSSTLPDEPARRLLDALEPLLEPGLADLEADPEEWRGVLQRLWNPLAIEPVGQGSGVALLSVTEARGLTFRRLALVDLARDRFPRSIRPDPMLPDPLRLRLRELLPDLPVKLEGHGEERFLFAQLLAAADEIALFRPAADLEGRELPPSPFLDERVRAGESEERDAPEPECPSSFVAAVSAALAAGEEGLAHTLPGALFEAGARWMGGGAAAPAALAATRLAVLRELGADPSRPSTHAIGPFLGAVGALSALDPRQAGPSVTALERFAQCGWQTFLERLLRLRPLPDLSEGLPSLPRRLVGSIVHRILESLLPGSRSSPNDLAAVLALGVTEVAWPGERELERRVRHAAASELAAEALDPQIFATTLTREALALLQTVRESDWSAGQRPLLATEVTGEAHFVASGKERRLPFRVDRVDRVDGEILLTDYKTGRPISTAKTEKTRNGHLRTAIEHGEALQLPVYLLGLPDENARARYLYLDPNLDERARELSLTTEELDDDRVQALFDVIYGAWDLGVFLPRMLEPDLQKSYAGCEWCEVREACLQGDSGARLRLEHWLAREETGGAFDRAARAWWRVHGEPRNRRSPA